MTLSLNGQEIPLVNAQSFVFRPGGVASANVFTDFALLWAAVQNVEGRRLIVLDGSLSSNIIAWPVGTYDFDRGQIEVTNVIVRGSATRVELVEGVVFISPGKFFSTSAIVLAGLNTATPIYTITAGSVSDFWRVDRVTFQPESSGDFILASGGFAGLQFYDSSLRNGLSTGYALRIDAASGSGISLVMDGISIIDPAVAVGSAGTLIFALGPSVGGLAIPQTDFSGSFIESKIASSGRISYVPAVPADWVDPDPVNVQEALDRLAAPVEPASPSLTIVTTQQQLDDAINAIPDQFVGHHVIEVRTSGLAINRSNFPQPQFNGIGHLDIIADRSAPVATKAVPAFVSDANFAAQFEDPAFGAHAGITAGTHWVEEDVSMFGAPYTTHYHEALPSVSPAVRVTAIFAPFGGAASVYPRTITLNLFGAPIASSPYLDGGGRTNRWGLGVRIIGFEADFGTAQSRMVGVAFLACDYRGFGRLEDCLINGHIGSVGGSNQIVATFSSGKVFSEVARIEGLHAAGGTVQLRGLGRIGSLFSEITIGLDYGCELHFVGDMDFRVVGDLCFKYTGNNAINLSNSDLTLGVQATKFIGPAVGLVDLPKIDVFFDPGAIITGTVVDAFIIQNGGSLINADDACEGTLVATGDEVLLDGVPLTYLDSVAGVFSLDTGSFMRS